MASASDSVARPRSRPGQQTDLDPAAITTAIDLEIPKAPAKSSSCLPSVLNPTPVEKLIYEAAIRDMSKKMAPYGTKNLPMQSIGTSIVLYDKNGAVLKVSDGLLLKSDVSLCYLITWLQIFTDNFLVSDRYGEELLVKGVEIRFLMKHTHKTYPELQGTLCYSDVDPTAVVGVSWPCDNSILEQYWEAYRNLMQVGIDDHIRFPMLKIKTVKRLARDPHVKNPKSLLGGGHKFVVGKASLEVHQYFGQMKEKVPDSLVQLDKLLTEANNELVIQNAQRTREMGPAQTRTHEASTRPNREETRRVGGIQGPSVRGLARGLFQHFIPKIKMLMYL